MNLNSVEKSANKSKVNNNKNNEAVFQSPELESTFRDVSSCSRTQLWIDSSEQVQALREDLLNLSNKTEEQIAIVKKATAEVIRNFGNGEWKAGIYHRQKKKHNFNNFDGRTYDQEMYMRLIEK